MSDIVVSKNIGEALCLRYRQDFERALGYELISGHLSFDNFLMAVKEDVLRSDKLREAFEASPGSAIECLVMAAQCKLLPGGKYELFYLIPRNIKGVPTVTPLIGYKGLMEMSKRHPRVHSIEGFCVYEGEEFEFLPGEGRIVHKWSPTVDREDSKIIAAYAKAIITEPTTSHVVSTPIVWAMTRKEIEKSRGRSEAYKWAEKSGKRDSPWHTDFPAMARKTALRALLKGGAVPRDMGLGGVLTQESEVDAPQAELPAPKPTQGSQMRAVLGIDKPVGRFEMVEFATAAIADAQSTTELERLASGWQHFKGEDAEQIALAYEQRLKEIES